MLIFFPPVVFYFSCESARRQKSIFSPSWRPNDSHCRMSILWSCSIEIIHQQGKQRCNKAKWRVLPWRWRTYISIILWIIGRNKRRSVLYRLPRVDGLVWWTNEFSCSDFRSQKLVFLLRYCTKRATWCVQEGYWECMFKAQERLRVHLLVTSMHK